MFVLKKKTLVYILCVILCGVFIGACINVSAGAVQTEINSDLPVIVIDAGHGGIDAGVYGVNTSVKESDINLEIARKLKGYFTNAGFECVMTRSTQAGLYGTTASGFKMRDMQKRKQIIEECGADMVISVHQNTCPLPSKRGAHVFYDNNSSTSKELALLIQKQMNLLEGGIASNTALAGDYYMLKCTSSPSVIVECGFLSNAEDETLLVSEDYQTLAAYAIFKGAISYFS